MSSKSQPPRPDQMLRDRLAQVEDTFAATDAFEARKRAQAISASDATGGWQGFARRPGYGAARARHDTALRADLARMQLPEIAAAVAMVRQMTSPLPADTCRIYGVITGAGSDGLTVAAVKPGGALLLRTSVAAGGQYSLDTRCTDKIVTLEIRDRADRLLLQDGAPLVLMEGTMMRRNFRIDRCGDLVPDRPSEDSPLRQMPDVVGETASDAEARIAKLGRFALSFKDAHDPASKGRVIAQDPAAGDPLKPDSGIVLTLSRGPVPETKMPDLVGKTPDAARKLLADLPFAALALDYVDDPDSAGRIVRQDPAAEAPLGADTRIMLCVGQAARLMPDVTGQTEASARKKLVPAVAASVTVTYSPEGKTPGHVTAQDPAAGKSVGPDTVVALTVTEDHKDSPAMPDLIGLTRAKAEATLARQGQYKTDIRMQTDAAAKGVVVAQDPAGGAPLSDGAQVTLTVSSGPEDDLRLPNLVGLTDKQARAALVPHLTDKIEIRTVSADAATGTITAQSPKAGTAITRGDAVTLDVAGVAPDTATVAMPDLHGMTSAQAKKALRTLGITSLIFDATEARRRGWQVVRQQPAAGRKVTATQDVRLKFGPKT